MQVQWGTKQVTIHVPDKVVEVEGMIHFQNQNWRDLPLRLRESLCHDLANLRKRTQYQFSNMNKSGNEERRDSQPVNSKPNRRSDKCSIDRS